MILSPILISESYKWLLGYHKNEKVQSQNSTKDVQLPSNLTKSDSVNTLRKSDSVNIHSIIFEMKFCTFVRLK